MGFGFLGTALRGDKKKGGGVFGFLDDTRKYGPSAFKEAVPKVAKGTGKLALDTARAPLRAGLSIGNSITDVTNPALGLPKATVPANPISGGEVQSIQKRTAGLKKGIGESRFRGKEGLAPALVLAGTALDATPFGGGKKSAADKLVNAKTIEEVKKLIPGIDTAKAQAIAGQKDRNIIKNVLQGKSEIERPPDVNVPPPGTVPKPEPPKPNPQIAVLDTQIKTNKDLIQHAPTDTAKAKLHAKNTSLIKERGTLQEAELPTSPPSSKPPTMTATPVMNDIRPAGQGTYKERGFISTVAESPLSKPQVAQGIKDVSYQSKLYKTAPNVQTLEKANEHIVKNPITATQEVFGDSTKPLKDIQAQGMLLMGRAQAEGTDEGYKQAIRIAEAVSKKATEGGQGSQILSVWGRLTPEGMLRYAQKEIDSANTAKGFVSKKLGGEHSLDPETAKTITKNMQKVATLPDGAEKDALVRTTMDAIAKKIPPGVSEKFDAFRYQNLLSNPRTHLRNALGNLTQAFITRPATLGTHGTIDWIKAGLFGTERQAYVKDVPTYYKNIFNNFSDGIEGMRGAWAGKIEQPDLMNISAHRFAKIPKKYTVVPRAMEASDKFLQNLVMNGEYAVQKSRGIADDIAKQKATETSKYVLFRNMIDPKNKTGQGNLLSKIDSITKVVNDAGKAFKPIRWFVPFIQTPMNITKQFIELSPAGFATLYGAKGVRREEQLAKAVIGTGIMGIGAKEALDGNTTWSIPTNKKERDEFYATGKKPYSVRIGDKWVPLITFGPFGYALGLGAAVKDAHDSAPIGAGEMEKLGKSLANQTKFFSQQTYVSGISHFVDMLSGASDTGVAGNLESTLGQAIPLQGLQRYVASVIDPVFRDQKGFGGSFKGSTPYLSKSLPSRKDVFTGQDAKRNFSDYVLPYSLGIPQGTKGPGGERESKEAVYQFQKTLLSRSGKPRTKAEDLIKAVLWGGNPNYEKAQSIADTYNKQLTTEVAKWNKKYGRYANESLQDMYNKKLISDNSLESLLRSAQKGQ